MQAYTWENEKLDNEDKMAGELRQVLVIFRKNKDSIMSSFVYTCRQQQFAQSSCIVNPKTANANKLKLNRSF